MSTISQKARPQFSFRFSLSFQFCFAFSKLRWRRRWRRWARGVTKTTTTAPRVQGEEGVHRRGLPDRRSHVGPLPRSSRLQPATAFRERSHFAQQIPLLFSKVARGARRGSKRASRRSMQRTFTRGDPSAGPSWPSSRSKFGIRGRFEGFRGSADAGGRTGGHGNESENRLSRRQNRRAKADGGSRGFFSFAFPCRLNSPFRFRPHFLRLPQRTVARHEDDDHATAGQADRRTHRTPRLLRRKEQGAPFRTMLRERKGFCSVALLPRARRSRPGSRVTEQKSFLERAEAEPIPSSY